MTYIFPERGKIDKTQFISDRSALVLKTCKIPNVLLKCEMLRFISLSFLEAAHAYSFYTKNFALLTKFSNSLAEKLSVCKILLPYNSWLSHNGKNTDFCILMRGPMPCWTWELESLQDNFDLFWKIIGFWDTGSGIFTEIFTPCSCTYAERADPICRFVSDWSDIPLKFHLKIPLKCHQPINIPYNGMEFSFIPLKFHQFSLFLNIVFQFFGND